MKSIKDLHNDSLPSISDFFSDKDKVATLKEFNLMQDRYYIKGVDFCIAYLREKGNNYMADQIERITEYMRSYTNDK